MFRPRIPIAMITGTKGKTTTTRMLVRMLSEAGHRVGYSSTEGVIIDGQVVREGDYAGYHGAHAVLSNRSITAAVLETARGGLLSNGLYVRRCNVAALTNVGKEHIGMNGVETLEQMADLKGRVTDAARDAVVLNADDPRCAKLMARYPQGRVTLFSLHADNPVVLDHIRKGGLAYVSSHSDAGDRIVRREGESAETVIAVNDMPSTRNGLFQQNIANAMAAAALAEGLGVPLTEVRSALESFGRSPKDSFGRLMLLEGYAQTVLIDSALQVPACIELVESLRKLNVSGRRICMFGTVGNRPEWHFAEISATLAPHFDHFICHDHEHLCRNRAPGEIPRMLKEGLIKADIAADRIDAIQGFDKAVGRLADLASAGDLVVVITGRVGQYLPTFRKLFSMHEAASETAG